LDADLWGHDRGEPSVQPRLETSVDPAHELFRALAHETDRLTYFDIDAREVLSSITAATKEVSDELLENHSLPVFENAGYIVIGPEVDVIRTAVLELADLSGGAVRVDDPDPFLSLYYEGDDIRRVMAKLNTAPGAHGRFIALDPDNSDSEIAIYVATNDLPKLADLLRLNERERTSPA
jgi:hypothetical protein